MRVPNRVSACRICGNPELVNVLELGQQTLTGVFPKDKHEVLTSGPLTLLKCNGPGACGLLQLGHSYSLDEMYGENYGYRSGLNPSMVNHLRSKVGRIKQLGIIDSGDIIGELIDLELGRSGISVMTMTEGMAMEKTRIAGECVSEGAGTGGGLRDEAVPWGHRRDLQNESYETKRILSSGSRA